MLAYMLTVEERPAESGPAPHARRGPRKPAAGKPETERPADRPQVDATDPATQEFARKVDVVRTTVKVSVDLDARIRQEAARRGMTMSAWTREALEAHLPGGARQPVRRLLAAGAGSSGRSDISERIEELLYGWGSDSDQ
jgi:predicted DNA binding CopG/RHH family protein